MKFVFIMKKGLLSFLLSFLFIAAFAQTKVSGYVFDENNDPIPFANVLFKGSTEGTITNEDGKFYLESDETWETLIVSFIGYEMLEIPPVSYTHLTLPTTSRV